MIRSSSLPQFRLLPIIRAIYPDFKDGVLVAAVAEPQTYETTYRLQKRNRFNQWYDYQTTNAGYIEGNAQELELYVDHLTSFIYLSNAEV